MGHTLVIEEGVFIPRPETEIVVEEAASAVRLSGAGAPSILEIGTGSGNIAIALTKILPRCTIVALDISPKALTLAQKNARKHGVENMIRFMRSDLFDAIEKDAPVFDMIVSNPPYIASTDMAGLQRELAHEPVGALDGGDDGMAYYATIIKRAPEFLNGGGHLVLEIGFDQGTRVSGMTEGDGRLRVTHIGRDHNGLERVVVARKAEKGRWISSS